jgi:hypothetical protein
LLTPRTELQADDDGQLGLRGGSKRKRKRSIEDGETGDKDQASA